MAENGRLPKSDLAPIAGGELRKDAAAAFNAMNVESRRLGLELRPTGSKSSYRTYAEQEYFWNLYQSGRGNLAAHPGTSNHGLGLGRRSRDAADARDGRPDRREVRIVQGDKSTPPASGGTLKWNGN